MIQIVTIVSQSGLVLAKLLRIFPGWDNPEARYLRLFFQVNFFFLFKLSFCVYWANSNLIQSILGPPIERQKVLNGPIQNWLELLENLSWTTPPRRQRHFRLFFQVHFDSEMEIKLSRKLSKLIFDCYEIIWTQFTTKNDSRPKSIWLIYQNELQTPNAMWWSGKMRATYLKWRSNISDISKYLRYIKISQISQNILDILKYLR